MLVMNTNSESFSIGIAPLNSTFSTVSMSERVVPFRATFSSDLGVCMASFLPACLQSSNLEKIVLLSGRTKRCRNTIPAAARGQVGTERKEAGMEPPPLTDLSIDILGFS